MKWMNESYFESIFAIFDEKSHFLSILGTFWAFFGHFSFSTCVNELSFELNQHFFNWIIFWIESWVKQYWMEYLMNHFLAKFKHWIKSDWVSATTTLCSSLNYKYIDIVVTQQSQEILPFVCHRLERERKKGSPPE